MESICLSCTVHQQDWNECSSVFLEITVHIVIVLPALEGTWYVDQLSSDHVEGAANDPFTRQQASICTPWALFVV